MRNETRELREQRGAEREGTSAMREEEMKSRNVEREKHREGEAKT